MSNPEPNHYATLGLRRGCTSDEIRHAYRLLAKRHHPDLHGNSAEARLRTQQLNAAHEVLGDPAKRRAYDRDLDHASSTARRTSGKIERNIKQEVRLRIEDFLRGASVDVEVRDAGNPDGAEHYQLNVAPGTAPGARIRLPRTGSMTAGFVDVRLKPLPGFRFKVRGSDLRCELRIDNRRATHGGSETIQGAAGNSLRIQIPAGVKRGETLRIPGEGMPKPRGGRGDLLVRITYRPELRVSAAR